MTGCGSPLVHGDGTAGEALWMQTTGAAQDRRCPPRLVRMSTAVQVRGYALGLLYLAAVQGSSDVGWRTIGSGPDRSLLVMS
jgi:hypothetical protein